MSRDPARRRINVCADCCDCRILFYPAAFYAAVYQKDELKGAAELGMEASAVHGGQTTHGGVPNETPT